MGNPQKLGNFVNALFQDASNNVGIGGSPSGSYKLEVTGTAKVSSTLLVSGAATFSSTADATIFNSTSNAFRFSGSNALSLVTLNSQNVVKVNAAGYWGVQLVGANDQGVVINNLGLVGIGTATPNGSYRLTCSGASSGVVGGLALVDTEAYSFSIYSASSALLFRDITNGAERMRITSAGILCVRTTSAFTSGLVCIDAGTDYIAIATKVGTTGLASHLIFNNPNGAVGSINTSGSTTTYNTSSDYRLKQDLKDYNGLDLVSAIKTYDYEWKSDNTRMYGVMAHELAEVIPYAVQGEKDAVDEEGNIKSQGADYSKIVPVLIKAIQELNQQNQDLKSRLDKAGL